MIFVVDLDKDPSRGIFSKITYFRIFRACPARFQARYQVSM